MGGEAASGQDNKGPRAAGGGVPVSRCFPQAEAPGLPPAALQMKCEHCTRKVSAAVPGGARPVPVPWGSLWAAEVGGPGPPLARLRALQGFPGLSTLGPPGVEAAGAGSAALWGGLGLSGSP